MVIIPKKTRKTCTNSTTEVDTSSRGTPSIQSRMLWTAQVCSNGLLLTLQASILVLRYPSRRYNFYTLTDTESRPTAIGKLKHAVSGPGTSHRYDSLAGKRTLYKKDLIGVC